MITASKALREYIRNFKTLNEFCLFTELSYPTVAKIINGKERLSSTVISQIKLKTGMDFEKAFEVKE